MIRTFRFALLGAAALGLAGTALAAAHDLHVMNVSLPDGSIAQVQYRGDVAPRVVAVPVATDPFAQMDAMFARMQAQHEAMMRQVAAMQAAATQAATGGQSAAPGTVAVSVNGKPVALPAGSSYFYSVTTTSNGAGKDGASCTQTVTMTGGAAGAAPQVQRASSGDCESAVNRNPAPVPASAPAPAPAAKPAKVPAPAGTHAV